MITDTELRFKGMQVLLDALGLVAAERFIALIQRERFDYTQWQKTLLEDLPIDELNRRAKRRPEDE